LRLVTRSSTILARSAYSIRHFFPGFRSEISETRNTCLQCCRDGK